MGRRKALLIVAMLSAVGCGRRDTDLSPDGNDVTLALETSLAGDAETFMALAESTEAMSGIEGSAFRAVDEACYPTWMGCQLCYSMDGTALAGEVSVGIGQGTCEVDTSFLETSFAYAVPTLSLDGTWTGNVSGAYTIEATGSREATLTIQRGEEDAKVWDTSWSLTDLTVTSTNFEFSALNAELTYSGLSDEEWDVTLGVEGTTAIVEITKGEGSCEGTGSVNASGEVTDLDLDCDF